MNALTIETAARSVYLVVGARSKVHRGFRANGGPTTYPEGCNIDAVAPDDREEITAEEARAIIELEPERRCKRCFWR